MIGIIINVICTAVGGIVGVLISKKITPAFSQKLNMIFGVCAIAMGVASIPGVKTLPAVILAIIAGTIIGLLVKLDHWLLALGTLMGKPISKIGGKRNAPSASDMTKEEYDAFFINAMILFCFGAMGIFACFEAGMTGNISILMSKSILDFVTAIIFACTLGLLASMIAIPQLVCCIIFFAIAKLVMPLASPTMIADFEACGGVILIATGLGVAGIKQFPVANMLPAMILIMPVSALWSGVVMPALASV